MPEEEPKRQYFIRVPVSEKTHNFLSVVKDSAHKAVIKQLRDKATILVEKLKRGAKL